MDTALQLVHGGLFLVLLGAEVVHLAGVGVDGVDKLFKLVFVKIEEIIESLLGSSDGVRHAFELGIVDVCKSLVVLAVHAYGESLHAECVKLFDGFLTFFFGLLQSLFHLLVQRLTGVRDLFIDVGLGLLGLSHGLDLLDEGADLVGEVSLDGLGDLILALNFFSFLELELS